MSLDSDITAKLHTENQELRSRINELQRLNNENTFKNLADNAPVAIHVLQGNHFTYMNSAFTSLTGYSLEECEDINFWDLIHPDYQDVIRERAWARQRGEEVIPVTEMKIISKYGYEIWVDHSATNTIWAGKSAITAILHDLTAHKNNEEKILHQHKILEETYAELEEIYAELQSSQNNLLEANERLEESEDRMDLAFWAADEGLWDLNIESGQLFLSDREVTMFGYDVQEIIPHIHTWEDLVHPDDITNVKACFNSHYTGKIDYFEAEYRLKSKAGEWIWILDRGRIAKRDKDGKPIRMVGTKRDISEKKAAQIRLKDSEERYHHLFDKSPIGLLKINLDGDILDANYYYVDIHGAPSKEAIIGMNLFDEARSRNDLGIKLPEIYEGYNKLEAFSIDIQFVSNWGRFLCMHYIIDPVFDHDKKFMHFIIACEEISERTRAEARIKYLSYNDSLTGLYNRAFFDEQLRQLDVAQQLPLSIIMGDVNGLKLLNDSFGHQTGDKLLIAIAAILKDACRTEDIIARWGGDEFVVLLPQTPKKIGYFICEQIRKHCQESNSVPIQASIALGVASKDSLDQDIYKVISEAEDIMYRNKLLESKSIRNSIISSLEASLHEKTFETREHAHRMQKLCIQFGQALGLPANEIDRLELLARLHDIGKIGIPDEILNKAGALTSEEWGSIQKHPEIGYRIVYSSHELVAISEEILSHHERWDGNGYPKGLQAKAIPLLARILSIVDAYDVMTHVRSYKKAICHEQALEEISRCSASQFDPDLVNVFIGIFTNN